MTNTATNKYLILQFNANDLKNHANEFQNVLYEIALIMETHYTKYSKKFIPQYKLIKVNHLDKTAHGSEANFIKSFI